MYIEFSLPVNKNGRAAYAALTFIQNELTTWTSRHHVQYTTKIIKHKYRVCFDDDKLYALFSLSWPADKHTWLANYRIISDLNNRT